MPLLAPWSMERRHGSRRFSISRNGRIAAVAAATLILLLSQPWRRRAAPHAACAAPPTIYSHRGFDAAESARVTTTASIEALLDAGITAFDLDVFWVADDPQLFIGHPPSLRRLWSLDAALVNTPLRELRARADVELYPLRSLLELVGRRPAAFTQVSLELKQPEHVRWPDQLARLYSLVAAAGVGAKVALVVEDDVQAAAHRAAQASARGGPLHVPLLLLLRDLDAPRDASGVPHANLSALASPSADGFAASAKLLDAPLADAARARGRPLCVWVVDDDASLRAAWELRVPCVITNLPTWAARRLGEWRAAEC